MAHKLIDRCKETTSTTGTGNLTLTGAVSGFVSMANAATGLTSNGDTGWFCAEAGTQWEVFLGTRVSATELARTTLLASSTGSTINFSAPPVVFSTVPAEKISTVGPAFRANRTTSAQGITNSTWAKVQLNAEDFDTANCFDSTTNYRWSPNVAGYYSLVWNVNLSPTSGSGGVSASALWKNGAEYSRGAQLNPSTATIAAIYLNGCDLVYMNGSTDYLELYAYMTGTSPLVGIGSFMAGHLVRPG